MRPLKFTFLLLLSVPTLLAAASFTPAMAARRDSLVVRGHVFDSLGVAIRESWVITQGSRRIGTLVEPSGAYVLVIPGASTEELIRSPLKLRVQARHKGWSIALAGGATELDIELRVVRDVDGIARLEVRSNDAEVAVTIANTAVLESSLRAEVWAEFKGTRGDQVDGGTEEMTAFQEVLIAGARDSIRYERIRARDVPPWIVPDLTAAAAAPKDSAANVVAPAPKKKGRRSRNLNNIVKTDSLARPVEPALVVATSTPTPTPTAAKSEPAPTQAAATQPVVESPRPVATKVAVVESPKPAPAQAAAIEAPKPAPVKTATIEAPKPAPVKTATIEVPKPAPTHTATIESPKPAPVQAAIEAPKPAPVQTATIKVLEPAPTQTTTIESPKPAPTQTVAIEAPKPTPTQTTTIESPKPAPVQAAAIEAPKPAPVQTATINVLEPAPAQTATIESPKPAPVQAAAIEAPKPAPVQTATITVLEPAPTQTTTIESPKPAPAQTIQAPKQAPVQTATIEVLKPASVEPAASASRPAEPISNLGKKAKQEQDRPIVFRPALDEKGSSDAAAQVYHPSASARPSSEPQKTAASAPASAPVTPPVAMPLSAAPSSTTATAPAPTQAPAAVPGRMWPTYLNEPAAKPIIVTTTPSTEAASPVTPPASAARAYTLPSTEESEPVKPAARPAPADSCTCRIHGTVEVEWDRPLPEKTPVTISIEGQPKLKDVAELFMGSPRDFELVRVPCGMLRLKVDSRSKLHLGLVTDPVIDCTGGGYRQIRLVLIPNKGR